MVEGGHLYDGLHVESMVADLLRSSGFVVLHQNFRYQHLEIDIIALEGSTLCFIEVKARGAWYQLQDIDVLIDSKKRNNLIIAAEHFIRIHPEFHQHQIRFDYALALIQKGRKPHVRYIKNAFSPGLR